MESCSYSLRYHLQETDAISIQLVFLYIKDHCEEDAWQSRVEERLGLVADFLILPNRFQD